MMIANFRRYLGYAAGEIVLIFAGITLALWFNNWNEERQLRTVELRLLGEIVTDFQANIDRFNRHLELSEESTAACRRFLTIAEHRDSWRDEHGSDLYSCMHWNSSLINDAAYESLKTRGIDIVSNPDVRDEIVRIYEAGYEFLKNEVERDQWAFHASVVLPTLNRYARYVESNMLQPNDFGSLIDSVEFMNMLHSQLERHEKAIVMQQAGVAATEKALRIV